MSFEDVCKRDCPKYLICKDVENIGMSMVLASIDSHRVSGDSYYLNEDGTYTSATEFFAQNDVIPRERREMLRREGTQMQTTAQSLMQRLVDMCQTGPDTQGEVECRSEVSAEIPFTSEDVEAFADRDVAVRIMHDLFPQGVGE